MERLSYNQKGALTSDVEQLRVPRYADTPTTPIVAIHRLRPYEPLQRASRPKISGQQYELTQVDRTPTDVGQLALDLDWTYESPKSLDSRVPPADVAVTRRILTASVDVLGGRRPAKQVSRYFSPLALAALETRAQEFCRMAHGALLRSVHACQPTEGVIEACAIIERGKRFQALVARLESDDKRWLCKLLRLV